MSDTRVLRQFVALAEELHFGRAAARLHITQPPLSMAMQALEARLGAKLFERTQRRVSLSEAGAALLPEVRQILARLDELPRLAQSAAAGQAGSLRLAFVSSIAYGPLPVWLRAFRAQNPELQLALREATQDVQLEAFARGEIDAGFMLHAPGAAPAGLMAWTALREPLVLALPEGHALLARTRITLAMLASEPLVIFPRGIAPSLYDAIVGAYRQQGHTPRVAQEAIQMQTLVNLVSAGIGAAWVPQAVTQLQRPGVVYRRVVGNPVSSETSLVWPTEASAVVRRFVAFVQQQRQSIATRSRSSSPP